MIFFKCFSCGFKEFGSHLEKILLHLLCSLVTIWTWSTRRFDRPNVYWFRHYGCISLGHENRINDKNKLFFNDSCSHWFHSPSALTCSIILSITLWCIASDWFSLTSYWSAVQNINVILFFCSLLYDQSFPF